MEKKIVNKVQKSSLVTINLLDFFPKSPIAELDIKPFLFQEMIVREKEFRIRLKEYNWEQYKDKMVSVFCSTDAIIPQWSYMLIASYLYQQANNVFFGSKEKVQEKLFVKNLEEMPTEEFQNKKVILKGCNDDRLNPEVFLKASKVLLPHVESLMYGEACSTVPIYKKKKIG